MTKAVFTTKVDPTYDDVAATLVAGEIRPGAGVPGTIDFLKHEPSACASSPEAFIQRMRERQMDALSRLDGCHFDIPAPARTIDVRIAPPGQDTTLHDTALSAGVKA